MPPWVCIRGYTAWYASLGVYIRRYTGLYASQEGVYRKVYWAICLPGCIQGGIPRVGRRAYTQGGVPRVGR